ncbi:hypothetical protein H0A36_00350 [Endozoicomonas sp. SM1973]|uniref:Lipoprotein n=1 Tax=Spartinivicinus marinus TaxID=2994442 RepID=A0A853I2K1_9GAMM|nr:hypothetical protein [Spartinivicinus marinus]MCX4026600.1 hypothetical protein [Spartinivicinus marinus]NYZ64434.1 hypothetical protein [Spartinivicinus marinus]
MKNKLYYIGVPILTACAVFVAQNFIDKDSIISKQQITNDIASVKQINQIESNQSIKKPTTKPEVINTEIVNQELTSGQLPEAEVNAIKAAISDLPSYTEKPAKLELWSNIDSEVNTSSDGVRSQSFNVNPITFEQLAVGQEITIALPNQQQLKAKISNTSNGTYSESWNAKVDNNSPFGSISITKNKEQSIIYVNSEQGEYEAYIDNKTGEASLVYLADVRAKTNF